MDVGDSLKDGRWVLERKLGAGGAATVFAARHRNGSRAAIKILDADLHDDAEALRRFLREGLLANTVGHPGVVRVLDEDVEDGHPYLVMELLDGESLSARRKRLGGKLPVDEVLRTAEDLLDVLAAAHEKGIVHRDIKPANLFLTKDGKLKVLDFGLAKLRKAVQGESTAIGTILGTPGFLAPETARGEVEQIDARSDLWAVGATIVNLLSGKFPHDERGTALIHAAMHRPARPTRDVAPQLAPRVAEVVDRALAFDKEARWPSARAMREALLEAATSDEVTEVGMRPRVVSLVDAEAGAYEPTAVATLPNRGGVPQVFDDEADLAPGGRTELMPQAPLRPESPTIPVPREAPAAPVVEPPRASAAPTPSVRPWSTAERVVFSALVVAVVALVWLVVRQYAR